MRSLEDSSACVNKKDATGLALLYAPPKLKFLGTAAQISKHQLHSSREIWEVRRFGEVTR